MIEAASLPPGGYPELERMLSLAAMGDNWRQVIHRCAWCRRIYDENGAYTNLVAFDATRVATDGMCSACGAHALAEVAARHLRHAA
jgi:hypothetical protein